MNAEGKKECGSSCSSQHAQPKPEQTPEQQRIIQRMARVKHRILVLSGKGGVGKSTVAANIAVGLVRAKKDVGLLDVDIHGPSIPKLLHLDGKSVTVKGDMVLPISVGDHLKVMSIGFLLPNDEVAVIWRGPRKHGLIQQFLADVKWGDLDVLVVDSPPGTGDEPLGVAQMLGRVDGAVIVTTPQDIAITDVRKCVTFCRQVGIPVLGIVENMSGFVCSKCGERFDIFKKGGGERLAKEIGVPVLGTIPIDPEIVAACDSGEPYLENFSYTEAGRAFDGIAQTILKMMAESKQSQEKRTATSEDGIMKIAIPVAEGRLCMHFGHCEEFALIDVDSATKEITQKEVIQSPPHEPGLLPQWIQEHGATTVIAGGMGARAKDLFTAKGITVVVGAPSEEPEEVVKAYVAGNLQTGENVCDH
ncbi:MAG: iron-sulfur cluster carrier protein MrpORP [bacterium]